MQLYATGCEIPFVPQFIEFYQTMVKQAYQLNWRACSCRSRNALIARIRRRAHFIHPCQCVIGISSENEASFRISFESYVESIISSVRVYLKAWVPLPKSDAGAMRLKNLQNDLLQKKNFFSVGNFDFLVLTCIICEK